MGITVRWTPEGTGKSVPPTGLKCPICENFGLFDPVSLAMPTGNGKRYWLARCPNDECRSVVYRFTTSVGEFCYPTARPRFDFKGVPESICPSIEEALDCASHGLWRSAAVMLRRVIELVLVEEKAQGARLVDQIRSLREKVLIPENLLNSLDNLRLLGNDAAHVELKDFDDVGQDEVDAARELVQVLVAGIYGARDAVEKLQALKRAPPAK